MFGEGNHVFILGEITKNRFAILKIMLRIIKNTEQHSYLTKPKQIKPNLSHT